MNAVPATQFAWDTRTPSISTGVAEASTLGFTAGVVPHTHLSIDGTPMLAVQGLHRRLSFKLVGSTGAEWQYESDDGKLRLVVFND